MFKIQGAMIAYAYVFRIYDL